MGSATNPLLLFEEGAFSMCQIFTSRIGYRFDTTVKSGSGLGKLLAPTWELVGSVKRHETQGRDARWLKYAPLTHEQYTDGYYALLRERYKADAASFMELVQRERLVICCYCAAGTFCHRHLAVDILSKIAAYHGLPLTCSGELPVG